MTAEPAADHVAFAGDLELDQLLGVLSDMREHLKFGWTESPSRVDLVPWEPDLDGHTDVRQGDVGRAFGAACEVRWLRRGDRFRVVVTSSGPKPSYPFPRALDLGVCDVEPTGYLLWGKYDADDEGWREERIPRTMRYPVTGAHERVVLDAVVYRDRESGEIVTFRLAGVRGIDG